MKKITFLFLMIQSGIIMAQTPETVVNTSGKKITFYASYIGTADNGLTLSTPNNVQLGGTLTQPSVLTTTSTFTLALKGLVPKNSVNRATDNVLMEDGNEVLRVVNAGVLANEPWYNAADNAQAWQNTQNIYTMGNVGIGQAAATTKLDIKSATAGAVKIVDGTQAVNYILTSDANGLATWKPNQPEIGFAKGKLPQTQIDQNSTDIINFGASIDLPPGKWMIYAGILLNPKIGLTVCEPSTNYMARFVISDSNSSITNDTFTFITPNKYFVSIANTGLNPLSKALFNKGCVMVTTTLPSTTLYLLSSGMGSAVGSIDKNDLENYFYAIRMQ